MGAGLFASGSYIELPETNLVSPASAVTIMLWVNLRDVTGSHALVVSTKNV